MTGHTVDASVVICAYTMDRWDDLCKAVASARNQTRPAREVFLVVDGNEELLQRARREIEGAFIVPNTNVAGLSGGRMTGAELAKGSVVVFLDDDAFADPCWLAELLAPYDADPNVLGVGGHIDPLWRDRHPKWFPDEFKWIVGCTYKGMHVDHGRIRNMIGANMSVRADVIARSGGFTGVLGRLGDNSMRTCDDTEFCIRSGRLFPGGVWMYAAKARVQHVVPGSRTTWKYFVFRCRMEGTSKGVLTSLVGSKDGLGSERRYALLLARSVIRDILTGRVRRAAALGAGFAITAFTFFRTKLTRTMAPDDGLGKPVEPVEARG